MSANSGTRGDLSDSPPQRLRQARGIAVEKTLLRGAGGNGRLLGGSSRREDATSSAKWPKARVGGNPFSPREWERISQRLRFSPREAEVVECLLLRMDDPEIAARFDLAVRTVRFHLERIYSKTEVHSRDQVLARVVEAHCERCCVS